MYLIKKYYKNNKLWNYIINKKNLYFNNIIYKNLSISYFNNII